MKRLYLAAVAGLWALAPVSAQEGTLAPTAPVVPAPLLQNGNLLAPSGGPGSWGASGSRLSRWSPFRSPVSASSAEPVAPAPAVSAQPLPPLPAGVAVADGGCGAAGCGPAGCGRGGRDRSCWERLKTWMCYHPSKTELPKCNPTPYVTPLQGMFPCTPVSGCWSGCGAAGCGATGCGSAPPVVMPPYGQPLPPRSLPDQPMTPPGSPSTSAGAVTMPPRSPQGGVSPMWQGQPPVGMAGYRFTTPAPVVNAGLTAPK